MAAVSSAILQDRMSLDEFAERFVKSKYWKIGDLKEDVFETMRDYTDFPKIVNLFKLRHSIVRWRWPVQVQVIPEKIGGWIFKAVYSAEIHIQFKCKSDFLAYPIIHKNSPFLRENAQIENEDKDKCCLTLKVPHSNSKSKINSEMALDQFVHAVTEEIEELNRPLDFPHFLAGDWMKFKKCLISLPVPVKCIRSVDADAQFIAFEFENEAQAVLFAEFNQLNPLLEGFAGSPKGNGKRVSFSLNRTDSFKTLLEILSKFYGSGLIVSTEDFFDQSF